MKFFLLKVSSFTLQINFRKPYVNNIVDASFDVCKHWPTDQSQRSISEIPSEKQTGVLITVPSDSKLIIGTTL